MTNEEKFRQVFRIPDEIEIADDICELFNCRHYNNHCSDCKFAYGDFWSQEYEENE